MVRVCVKASLAEGLTIPNVKNDAGQTKKSLFLRRRRRPKAGDAFTRTRLMPTFGVSAERPTEGPKVGVQGCHIGVVQGRGSRGGHGRGWPKPNLTSCVPELEFRSFWGF